MMRREAGGALRVPVEALVRGQLGLHRPNGIAQAPAIVYTDHRPDAYPQIHGSQRRVLSANTLRFYGLAT